MKQIIKTLLVFLLLVLEVIGWAQTIASKPKRIFITLDVSGSMEGNKYVMANYVAQTISVFSSEDDKVILYYFGDFHDISGEYGYNSIQIPFGSLDGTRRRTYREITDLTSFLRDYRPDPAYEDWLFIVGDGHWSINHRGYDSRTEFNSTWSKLKDFLLTHDVRVCFLQTGEKDDETSAFSDSLTAVHSPNTSIDIKKTDTIAENILKNCVYFANRILGFSNAKVNIEQESEQCVSFRSEFPLKRFVLLYQSDQEGAIRLNSVTYGQHSISSNGIRLKGQPSTKPLVDANGIILNGAVWEIVAPSSIPANEKVKVCFNRAVDTANVKMYPYVDVLDHVRPWTVAMDSLREVARNRFIICAEETKVNVILSLTDSQGQKFPPPLMEPMIVKMFVDGERRNIPYHAPDTSFHITLPLRSDTLMYYFEIESPGYFNRISETQMVIKSREACPQEQVVVRDTTQDVTQRVPFVILPVHQFEGVTFEHLMQGGSFGGFVDDTLLWQVASAGTGTFDEESLRGHDSWMLEMAGFSFENRQIRLTQKPKFSMCECAFPDTLRYEVTLRSDQGIMYEGKLYEGFKIPVVVPVVQRSWKSRCWMYGVAFVGLLLLMLYLRALRRKHRFGKDASIKPVYYDRYGEEVDNLGDVPLRENGLWAKLARWLWPADERNTLYIDVPMVQGIEFVATESYAKVNVVKKSIDPSKTLIANYNPEDKDDQSKFVSISNNEKITIMRDENTEAGYLQFRSGEKAVGAGFRVFTLFLIFLAMAAEGFVLFIILQSIIHF